MNALAQPAGQVWEGSPSTATEDGFAHASEALIHVASMQIAWPVELTWCVTGLRKHGK